MIYVFDRHWAGAIILRAGSRQEAADRLKAAYPSGFLKPGRKEPFHVAPEQLTEYGDDDIVETVGDL